MLTHSDAAWRLWHHEPGIYARSCVTLNDMGRNFRKFTRVRDESGKWFYFRFWEADLFKFISHSQEKTGQFLDHFMSSGVTRVIAISQGNAVSVVQFSSSEADRRLIVLNALLLDVISAYEESKKLRKITDMHAHAHRREFTFKGYTNML